MIVSGHLPYKKFNIIINEQRRYRLRRRQKIPYKDDHYLHVCDFSLRLIATRYEISNRILSYN
jgi:hypothetical protein